MSSFLDNDRDPNLLEACVLVVTLFETITANIQRRDKKFDDSLLLTIAHFLRHAVTTISPSISSDAATYLTNDRPERHNRQPAEDDPTWYPQVVSSYAVTESAHWSRRLDNDVKRGMAGVVRRVARVATAADRDFYGREDVDLAHLERRPASFAIFGKPGLPADSLADALSAYWGCVHVSVAAGLAAGRAGARTAWALRRGKAVTAASTAAQLNAVLALRDPEVRERGYVLTGFPRHDPEFSANAQIDAVFSVNPPDVLIYMSCPNQDIDDYYNGLILESTEHDRLKQMLHLDRDYSCNHHGYVRWYKSLRHRIVGKLSLEAYEQYSFKAVDEIVKQFDSEFVITVDGRRPVDTMFEIIKAKLMATNIQRTVLPTIIKNRDESSVLSKQYTYSPESVSVEQIYKYETENMEDYKSESMGETIMRSAMNVREINENDEQTNQVSVSERNEKIRLMSEFGQLCPVNFFYGLFKFGLDNYCVQYMGKLYFFAGSEEIQLFCKFPKRFLEVPRTGLPIRAIFYGPETLASTAAKAVGNFFGYNLIDVNNITHTYKEHEKRTYLSTVVKSLLENAQEINKFKKFRPSEIGTMRHAIGDWIRLYFENISSESLNNEENNESINEMFEDYSEQKTIYEYSKEEQLIRLRNYFESYGIDFIDDLDACVRVYEEPLTLITYFQYKLKQNKSALKSNLSNKNQTTQLELMDVIVDEVRIRNCKNKNWIIVNVPLDIVLVKKLIAANLNPIQLVFFCDTDPMHKVLLTDNISDEDRNGIIWETVESVRNGRRYETTVEKLNYLERVETTDNTPNVYEEEYDHFDNEYEIEDSYEYASINISHDRIMKMIMPEITERLNQYTQNLLEQWHALKTLVSHETNNNYIDFNVIECNPDSATNIIKTLVEDTLRHVKKFLSDNVYDVSTTDPHDTVPDTGKHNGDTSVYCPVRFANGQLAIGSKKYTAVYQNRYYYMSSSDNLEAFISNPRKYASFTSVPKRNPKPKISVLYPFGHSDHVGLIKHLSDAFDLIIVDSHEMFVEKVLPKDIPMLGKMYEEPTLKKITDKYFVPENRDIEYVDSLRMYMDRENADLNYEDWMKMSSIFFHNDEGICYKNYPRSVTELMYLKENGMNPDVIVELTGGHGEKENAKKAVLRNWLTYQNALIDRAVARDDTTRRNTVKNRSIMFKKKLAEVIRRQKADDIRSRIRRMIAMIAVEIVYGLSAIEHMCNDQEAFGDGKSWRTSEKGDRRSDFHSLCRRLTLKRKIMIVNYGLDAGDLLDLDDLTELDRIDEAVNDEHADRGFVASECFSDGLELPSDATVERHLVAERAAVAGMRRYAESSGIPWITDDGSARSTAADAVTELLRERAGHVLETTFDVDVDASEDMLRAGEAYLSAYGRRCPVRANERPDSARTFHADRADGRVRPVVHRNYVYYVSGPENRDKFVRRPLDYALRPFPAAAAAYVPLRIAVLGPSGGGRSRHARRLCDRHGFQLIRIEDAAGPYLTAYWWTDAGKSASLRLRRGDALSDFALAETVKSAARSPRAAVQGYVIDGFPTTRQQFRLMDDAGVILHRVFVVDGSRRGDDDDDDVVSALTRHRRAVWREKFVGEPWISEHYGNAAVVRDDDDDCDGRVDASIATCMRSLREYRAGRRARRPCRLADVPVTKSERADKMTTYLDACPVCRTDDGVRNRPRDPAALRRASVLYRSHFYWTCGEHYGAFACDPDAYADRAPAEPEPLAEAADDGNAPAEHRADGVCVVCALARLWDPVYRRGRPSHAVEYGGRTFACCSAECFDEFVRRPVAYSRYKVRVAGPLLDDEDDEDDEDDTTPRISSWPDVARFPDLGYLEQTVGLSVGSALAELMVARPVHPGLSVDVTAIVFLGLYVGATDAVVDRDVRRYYRDAFHKFYAACNDFKMVTFALKYTG